jgi:hypothetical protein
MEMQSFHVKPSALVETIGDIGQLEPVAPMVTTLGAFDQTTQ